MEKRYMLNGLTVRVRIGDGLVSIVNDPLLRRAVGQQPEMATTALVGGIKADYEAVFGKVFAVADNSLVVEIWGHLLADHFLLKYKRVMKVILWFGLYQRLCRSCAVIDCGERGKDPNRRLWDALASFRKPMARWLARVKLSG